MLKTASTRQVKIFRGKKKMQYNQLAADGSRGGKTCALKRAS